MGNLCSKSSTHSGGHTLVDPARPHQRTYGANGTPPGADVRQAAAQATENRRKAGQGADVRQAAAQAAENRRKAEQSRGVNRNNPNQGRLAAKLEASKSGAPDADEMPDRLVWD